MATTPTGSPLHLVVPLKPSALWERTTSLPAKDAAARAFRPMWKGGVVPLTLPLRPVEYLCVPRRRGTEEFPRVRLRMQLAEPLQVGQAGEALRGSRLSMLVPRAEGARVEFEVGNLWDEDPWDTTAHGRRQPVRLQGTLKADLSCVLTIEPDTVRQWLDPERGPLGARLNENLLEFRYRIPALEVDGKPLSGISANRLFLYRRKVLVFIPGVFGSQVQVATGDGNLMGFPDFCSHEGEASLHGLGPGEDPWHLKSDLAQAASQRIGVLECDADGQPLAPPIKPKLLMMRVPVAGAQVYDPFVQMRAARVKLMRAVPEDFMLYEVQLLPYDWRLDLESTAKEMMAFLAALQEVIRQRRPDVDDEVAVAGHSTGGVLLRRMLGEPGAESVIGHAFFMNVPFRGAPKALAVMLTGCDPLGGGAMIPFVAASSLRDIALNAPIVYHLAPSNHYPHRFLRFEDEPEARLGAAPTADEQKREWVKFAVRTRILPRQRIVPAGAATGEEHLARRLRLALGADAWAQLWEGYAALKRVADTDLRRSSADEEWLQAELKRRGLETQGAARTLHADWNDTLEQRATKYHDRGEEVARSGRWKERAFVFFSLSPEPTTLGIRVRRTQVTRHRSTAGMLQAAGIGYFDGLGANFQSLRTLDPCTLVADRFRQLDGQYEHSRIELTTVQGRLCGDGTVPLSSLLGFGGPVRVFRRLRDEVEPSGPSPEAPAMPESTHGPGHVPAPNHPWAWEKMVQVLQGHRLPEEDFEKPASVEKLLSDDPLFTRAWTDLNYGAEAFDWRGKRDIRLEDWMGRG